MPTEATDTAATTGTPGPHGGDEAVEANEAVEARESVGAAVRQSPERMVPEDQLRRALADLDNLRKRAVRDAARECASERTRVLSEWLPIVDDLGRALEHAGDDAGPVVEGVREVYRKAQALLERLGFPPFDDTGKQFDAARHEVVAAVDDGSPPGTIVATVRTGYGTPEHLLRPAGVVVSRHAD
jgi:molecular chaperone GrpE